MVKVGEDQGLQAHRVTGSLKRLLSDLMHHATESSLWLAAQMKKFVLIVLTTAIVFDLLVMWILCDRAR
jgi:hypothetical protein